MSWNAAEARDYFESGGSAMPRHAGLDGAETLAYYELQREAEKQASSTMIEALQRTLGDPGTANDADGTVRAGARVQIHGLVNKPELNWRLGTVVGRRADGRWAVTVDAAEGGNEGAKSEGGGERQVAFRESSLRVLDGEKVEVPRYVAAPEPKGSSERVQPEIPMLSD